MYDSQPSARPYWGEVPVKGLNDIMYINGNPVTPEQLQQHQARLENASVRAAGFALNYSIETSQT